MPASLEDRVLDFGLNVLVREASHVYLCSAEPTTYAQAITTYALGFKSFGAGNVFGAPVDAAPHGRKVMAAAITDGTVTTSGTAAWWAITDAVNSRLLAHGTVDAFQVFAPGNFTFGECVCQIPEWID